MDNFTYTRHRKLACCGKWRISGEFVRRNSPALVYHNPLVGGPNPSAATRINKRPDGSFFYSVRRGDEGQPDGGPTRRQKADGSMPVCNANLSRGMKHSGINPSAATKIQTSREMVLILTYPQHPLFIS